MTEDDERTEGVWHADPPALRAAWVSDIGKVRRENQDRVATGPGVVAVADGVGSAPGSAQVAAFVVREFVAAAEGARDEAGVIGALLDVQRRLVRAMAAGDVPATGATTLTAAVHCGDHVVIVNTGDSPAWAIEAGRPRLVSTPHRRWDPFLQGQALLSALGRDVLRNVSSIRLPVDTPLRVVLASDGVLDPDSPDDHPAVLRHARRADRHDAVRAMLAETLQGAATDNISVAVVDAGPERHWIEG